VEATDSDNEFLVGSSMLLRRSKGGRGRAPGVFMGGLGVRRGLGFCSGGAMDGGECVGLAWYSCWRKKRGLTHGARLSAAGSVPLRVLASWASV
jgi:hypothetical protein